ncbi:peptidylprolyl isomerase [Dolichospermum sp. ST_con]|nr:peptidylprolyl isomerase [Dolichospermum sp. ST_con]MDD1421215.1 peptidylprolyl isomerase [Dolichospermum sp. ST_sed1]MDD1427468.1 peptidylprolyl isomerase [Dolichospermum sp. ST_sed9]MDD1433316.1 peptidylprolyl isomerase [Dolichospermum sp. ST_sed6]MDD1436364.1 peptidylprolyl isomerase [Dolichospermum sp. ST_sed10]MDD1442685.1 peptidylprolyl isomerase [Dolichospermum sp. ST_sed3]MDD1448905.1 peptidylprolyl isomerase [Dolichospermum sp. ST_sed8]MDD1457025.1 peptidylprolyl isomerase [Dolic
MSNIVKVSNEDIIYHLKISCQIPGLLEAIASRQIITETAEKEGIAIEIAELQQSADSLRLVNNLVKAEDTWEWLRKHYLSLDNFEEIANLNLLSAKLAHHLFAEKVEPFFYAHQIDYSAAVTYEAVLDDEDLALELFYALKEGEISFQEIARQYIQNPEIRRAGGYQGIRKRSDFRPEIASAVFAANPPEILKPVITPKGVHIIVVEEIIAPELNEQVRIAILGDLFTNWLKEQINQLEIVATLADNTNFSYAPAEILSKAS